MGGVSPNPQGHASALVLLLVEKGTFSCRLQFAHHPKKGTHACIRPRVHACYRAHLALASLCPLFPPLSASRHIRVYLPPLDSSTPDTYCSKAVEFQAPLVFNDVFRIPVHSSMLTLKSLQLYVCSVNPQLQEELLVWLVHARDLSPPSIPVRPSLPL